MGDAETDECPVDIRPAERAGHGWTALDLQVKRDAERGKRAGRRLRTNQLPTMMGTYNGYVAQLVRARHS